MNPVHWGGHAMHRFRISWVPLLLATLCVVATINQAKAAEIFVICGGGIGSMMTELGQQFERETGHKLTISYGISSQLGAQIEAGARFDLAILTEPVPEQMVKQGHIRGP